MIISIKFKKNKQNKYKIKGPLIPADIKIVNYISRPLCR